MIMLMLIMQQINSIKFYVNIVVVTVMFTCCSVTLGASVSAFWFKQIKTSTTPKTSPHFKVEFSISTEGSVAPFAFQ